ncbi:MAG: serine/threonine-protein kinase [Polyangiales bacterium]
MTSASVAIGEVVLGKYEIKSALGVGGMGQVFRARHLRLDRDVAVKVLPSNGSEEHALRFEREAALMTRVRHPNVVEIVDFGFVHGKKPCIVMELVEGESLSARIERSRALPWFDAVKIILGVLDGLEAVHEAQILHRDLKPSNVAIAKGPPEVVKLLDFGIARSLMPSEGDRRVTRTGNIVGSLDYMSPEALVNDPIDVRTDVYAAGMMLYEMLSGGFPFRDDAMAAAFRRLSTDPPLPVAPSHLDPIPPGIAELSMNAIARDRVDRPASADEFAHLLREQLVRARRPAERSSSPHIEGAPASPKPPPLAPAPAAAAVAPVPIAPVAPAAPAILAIAPASETTKPAVPSAMPPTARERKPTPPPMAAKKVLKGVVVEAPRPPPVLSTPPPVVHPSAPRIESPSSSGQAMQSRSERPQFVVLAQLPDGKLSLVEERRWLFELVRNAGKAYALNADVWCAVLYAVDSAAAEKHSLVLLDALESRYPKVKVLGGTIFDPKFELKTIGPNVAAAALPDPIPSLLAMLATMKR